MVGAVMGVIFHDVDQGSDEWLALRCGILTASEMKLIVAVEGGGTIVKYRATGDMPARLTTKREQALSIIGGRMGVVRELAFAADVSEGVIRDLIKAGAMEAVKVEVPLLFKAAFDEKERAHLYELLAQRITRYVEPHYFNDDMLRGQVDEIEARDQYEKRYPENGPVKTVGFITNDEWGFTLGYSPDGLVGDRGLIEAKSRRQKFQVQTIIENVLGETIPADFMLQCQTGPLVAKRDWVDFISYSGGLPMATVRVHPDAVIQNAIIEASGAFEKRLAAAWAKFNEAMASRARLIPTVRRIELEMFM